MFMNMYGTEGHDTERKLLLN